MMKMTEKALQTIERYDMLSGVKGVVVGVSGGADSVALLHFLNSIKNDFGFSLRAAHVNHLLRGREAQRDEDFVREICEKASVPLSVLRKNVRELAEEERIGEEECGRKVRYDFFESLIKDNGVIATAHTLSDSIETLIFNLSRGSGIHGLCGIPPKRERIIRPFIECTRAEIEEYCKENSLQYVTDSTNFEKDYTRNRIRLEIIPKLYDLNPSLDKVLLRMIRQNIVDDSFLIFGARELLDSSKRENGLSVRDLKIADKALLRRALILFIKKMTGADAQSVHISDIEKNIEAENGAANLPGDNICIVKDGILRIMPKKFFSGALTEPFCVECTIGENVLPTGRYVICEKDLEKNKKNIKKHLKNSIDCDMINGRLFLRNRREGDSIRLAGRNCTKTLKKLFNESGTELEKRNRLLIISDDDGIIWLEGFGASERVKITENTKRVLTIDFLG